MQRKEISFCTSDIVDAAQYALDRVEQWSKNPGDVEWESTRFKYLNRAEILIELLEVKLCGSTGGYDKGQEYEDRKNLLVRFNWVMNHTI